MIQTNLAYEFIDDIPWDSNPAFAFSDDSEKYIEAFKSVIDTIPIKNSKISFSDDVWDFNPYYEGINSSSLRILFTGLPETLTTYCKFFVLHGIMGKRKISTINVRFSNFRSLFQYISENTSHDSIYLITTDDIIEEVSRRNISSQGEHELYVSAAQVYSFLKGNYRLDLPVDVDKLTALSADRRKSSKLDDSKLPNIPEEYFNAIVYQAVCVMRDKKEYYNNRVTACILVMLSQLGLRLGDLLGLHTGQLIRKVLTKSEREADYIHYKSRKPSKPHDAMLEFDIFSDSLCSEAFHTLLEIRDKCPLSQGNDYLIVYDHTIHTRDELPVTNERFNAAYKKFLYNYLPELSTKDWAGVRKTKWPLSQSKSVYLSVPDTRQYRVHICTALYEHNIPLAYIQKYMGHLSEYMLGYYVRPKDTYQENIKYSEQVIKEIAEDDLTPLGGAFGPEIKESIQKFIEEHNFNVATDIDEIVKAMGDNVIIRGKTGGVCIKTSLMPCAKDARTNEMFCAYDICPNLFAFYYMADISYLDFQTLQSTYTALKDAGNIKASQKELNKLKELCRRRLVPELDELSKEINRKGKDAIIIKYPSLSKIISDYESIREEIEIWMTKN